MRDTALQGGAPAVPARARRGADAGERSRDWSWVEAAVWTERMVSALENGVKGGRWYSLRKKSLTRLKDRIRAKTRRTRGDSLTRIVADLNPVLRGWFGYFKHAHPYTFPAVDGFVRRRLRALLRKQERRPGFGRCLADQTRWTNAFFAKAGLFALYPAWLAARHSR